jgi:hypothetical protein
MTRLRAAVLFLFLLGLGAGCGNTPPTGPVQTSLGKPASFGAGPTTTMPLKK